MTYQRSIEERDEAGEVEWRICYVCEYKQINALADLAGPEDVLDQACDACQKHGAPETKPKDWTRVNSNEVLVRRKTAEPPPPAPRPLSKEEKERRDRMIEEITRNLS